VELDPQSYEGTLLIVEGLIIPCCVLMMNIYLQITDDTCLPSDEPEPLPRPVSRRKYEGRRRAGR